MRKVVLLVFLMATSWCVKAQNVQDFSMTDHNGVEWNLFEELGKGKTVILDFFFVDCKPCQTYTPMMEQVYQDYGADTGTVLILGISDRDNNLRVKQFETDYGSTYPSCGFEGGGDTITTLYQNWFTFLGWPTYAVICPDTTIQWNLPKSDGLPEIRDSLKSCPDPVMGVFQDHDIGVSLSYNSTLNKVYLNNKSAEGAEICILDVLGKVCLKKAIPPGQSEIKLNTILHTPGMYLLRLQTNQGYTLKKVLITMNEL